MKKVAWFSTHPIQYYSPMYKEIASDENIDLMVYYFSDFSIKGYKDKEFGTEIKWDIPLLEGYKSKILKNYTNKKHGSFFSYLNFGIFNEIKNNNYDLVIVHGWNTLSHILIFISCILTATPYALRGDSNSFGESSRKGFKQLLRKWFLKTIFTKASAIFYIGEQNKKFYRHFNVSEQKMFIMPFAVSNDYFIQYKNRININQEKKNLKILDDEIILLFSGKLIALKQVDILIKALSKINRKYKLLIIGDGEERKVLEELSSKLNVNSKFLGFINQNEIPKYYWISDIFIMPSNKEAWGLSINEAMCCECAIIVSDKVGAKDDLVKGNGFVFTSDNITDLSNKINTLVANTELLDNFKKKSTEIINNYTYKQDIEAINSYFSSRIKGKEV